MDDERVRAIGRNQWRTGWVCVIAMVGMLISASVAYAIAKRESADADTFQKQLDRIYEFQLRQKQFDGLIADELLDSRRDKTAFAKRLNDFLTQDSANDIQRRSP